MDKGKTKHEQDEQRMRNAALEVATVATQAGLEMAVDAFMQAEIDWWNSIPRDGRAIPLQRVGGER